MGRKHAKEIGVGEEKLLIAGRRTPRSGQRKSVAVNLLWCGGGVWSKFIEAKSQLAPA
ncbi:MAG: hypothetical protein LC776_08585 [Acidobacteria bacterium]|nr:hypothetical protein [Acidobacteriota bacterium]